MKNHVEQKMKHSLSYYTCFCGTPLNVIKEKRRRERKINKHKLYTDSKDFKRLRGSNVKITNKCTLCDIVFEFRSSLRVHLMMHFDETNRKLLETCKRKLSTKFEGKINIG